MFPDLPEGQTNSFQAQVLAVWPDAYAYKSIIFHTWSISANGTFLCSVAGFNTETLAWADAVKRIKEKQND